MILHNKPFTETELEVGNTPLNTLQHGQQYRHPNGKVHQVFKRDDTSITIRRNDGWLVTITDKDFGWGVKVIKV